MVEKIGTESAAFETVGLLCSKQRSISRASCVWSPVGGQEGGRCQLGKQMGIRSGKTSCVKLVTKILSCVLWAVNEGVQAEGLSAV